MEHIKLIEFINKVSGIKMKSKKRLGYGDPRFLLLEKIVTEDMAEVALALEYRFHQTPEVIAKIVNREVEETRELLWDLAMVGVASIKKENGVDTYWYETWVPGIFEMVVNNKENVANHPQISKAFDDYGLLKNPAAAGNFPIGKGLMRVIPIESAIDGTTKSASYEEVSYFLDSNELFSVADCSCRTSREEMGEGCGHLKENMCIQMGDAAEYYIRTGRGREITREEAYEIIKVAEEDGLMHQVPNTEGPGHTHAICNCCGCGCYALRAASMYHNPDMVRSNYVSQVEKHKCVGCGECIEVCPTNAIKLGQKLCVKEEIVNPVRTEFPNNTEWGPDKWNPDYRDTRSETLDSGTSPCKTECSAHISIPAYIKLASQGRYKEALELIKKENPFPAVCGRVCPAICEEACTRSDLDEAVAIDDIKKFIADQDLNLENRYIPRIKHDYSKSIAVIGGGPSGLSCAYYLAIEGYKVTVFEKEKKLGGMLTFGIPNFRLEKEVINAEIDILRELGVTFQTGVEVGTDITISEMRKNGIDAFYIAIGAQKGRNLNLKNEDVINVATGVDFLRDCALDNQKELTGNVLVIGGGNVAIDVARTAVRYGALNVSMYCLEDRDGMPALDEEINEAIEENIEINNQYGPVRFLSENGKVTGVEFHKAISIFDETGRYNPLYDANDTMIVKADHVLVAVGQVIDFNHLLDGENVELNKNNTISVDSFTLQSSVDDIFAGGDVVTGPKYAIDAIALGKEASISIHRFVNKGHSLIHGRNRKDFKALDKDNVDYKGYDRVERQRSSVNHIKTLKGSFDDPRGILTEEQIIKETARCMGCGITVVDEFLCVGCGACTTRCKFDAITLDRRYDEEGVDFPQLKPLIIKHALKRKVKIAAKKIKQKFVSRG